MERLEGIADDLGMPISEVARRQRGLRDLLAEMEALVGREDGPRHDSLRREAYGWVEVSEMLIAEGWSPSPSPDPAGFPDEVTRAGQGPILPGPS